MFFFSSFLIGKLIWHQEPAAAGLIDNVLLQSSVRDPRAAGQSLDSQHGRDAFIKAVVDQEPQCAVPGTSDMKRPPSARISGAG
jgi:hypothetical protein